MLDEIFILPLSVSSHVRSFNDDIIFVDKDSNSVISQVQDSDRFFGKHQKLQFEIELYFTLQNRVNQDFFKLKSHQLEYLQ